MTKVHLMLATGVLALPLAFGAPAIAADEHKDAANAAAADADNTKRNARDADGHTLTPLDQGESETDRTITQQIRKQVVGHDQLSTNAKNVKIITQDGVVTLRGPVKSATEKKAVADRAKSEAGVKRVDDLLEIAPDR